MNVESIFASYEPPGEEALRALAVAERWIPVETLNHSLRSWVLADQLGRTKGPFDRDALFVASVLHDLALFEPFDSHRTAFETAGGAVAAVFATGIGWDEGRARRVAGAIEAHMADGVTWSSQPEGFLLEAATAADVSGRGLETWDPELLEDLTRLLPRGDFATCFATAIADQAARKPDSAAAGLHASGRIAAGDQVWVDRR